MTGSVYPVSQSVQLQQHPRCFLRGFDTSVTHSQWHLLSQETWALTAPSISLSAHLTFCTSGWGCAELDVATQAISSNLPKDPLRKSDIHDPGNSGSSCDDAFSCFFVFGCLFFVIVFFLQLNQTILLQGTKNNHYFVITAFPLEN